MYSKITQTVRTIFYVLVGLIAELIKYVKKKLKPKSTRRRRRRVPNEGKVVMVFETRYDAESALKTVKDIVRDYGFASLRDFFDATTGYYPSIHSTDEQKLGWYDLKDAAIVRTQLGYAIAMPEMTMMRKETQQ